MITLPNIFSFQPFEQLYVVHDFNTSLPAKREYLRDIEIAVERAENVGSARAKVRLTIGPQVWQPAPHNFHGLLWRLMMTYVVGRFIDRGVDLLVRNACSLLTCFLDTFQKTPGRFFSGFSRWHSLYVLTDTASSS
jgi:hypothetical protein